jgi:hypothetical protein
MLRPRALTSAPALSEPAREHALIGEQTPERPVKKMRVRHDLFVPDQAVVTKWQRRRSSLPSKLCFAGRSRGRSNSVQERSQDPTQPTAFP